MRNEHTDRLLAYAELMNQPAGSRYALPWSMVISGGWAGCKCLHQGQERSSCEKRAQRFQNTSVRQLFTTGISPLDGARVMFAITGIVPPAGSCAHGSNFLTAFYHHLILQPQKNHRNLLVTHGDREAP